MDLAEGSSQYHWRNVECGSKRKSYACMTTMDLLDPGLIPTSTTEDSCPDTDWIEYGEECFLFASNNEMPREHAQQYCQKVHKMSHLVTIGSAEENTYVRTLLHRSNTHVLHNDFWIGLKVKATGGLPVKEGI